MRGRGVGDDVFGVLGPGEGVRAVVPGVDVVGDGGLEFFDAGERAAPDGLAGDDRRRRSRPCSARSRGGGEVQRDPRVLRQPRGHVRTQGPVTSEIGAGVTDVTGLL